MAPYVILQDTGLLPSGEAVAKWINLARRECSYFCLVANHYILNGLRVPRSKASVRLGRLDAKTLRAIHREIRAHLDATAAFLEGGPAPDNYYIYEPNLMRR